MKTMHPLYLSPATRQRLGKLLLAGSLCWAGAPLCAETAPQPSTQQNQPGSQALLNQQDLKEMVGPIALYPDALIALILPASTVPSDVVLGARFVDAKADPAQAGNQPWDESVRSLVYYPDVLSWMNENLEWTASLGEAFMDQPADVMNAIQSLRAQARASGALTDTPQQRVVVQEETVRILPADPEYIYVPQYDPVVVFADTYGYGDSYAYDNGYGWGYGATPFLTFGIGFAVGSWLNYDCNWNDRYVYRGDWIGWGNGRGGRGGDVNINNTNINNINTNVVNINSNGATRWNATDRSRRQLEARQRNGGGNARFTTAEARAARDMIRTERRDNKGRLSANTQAAARRDTLPAPKKLELREAAFNRTARAQQRDNQKDGVAEVRRDRDNATPNKPGVASATERQTDRQELRRKPPTEAPRVNGQADAARMARQNDESRPEKTADRQNARQQLKDQTVERPNQIPARAPRQEDVDRPTQRPSVSERQPDNGNRKQEARQEVQDRQDRPPQPKQVDRDETRAQPNRQVERPRTERPQPRQEARQEPQRQVQPQRQERQVQPQRQAQPERQAQPQRQERQAQPKQQERREQPQRQEAKPQQRQAQPQRQESQPQQKKSAKKSDEDNKKKD